MPEIPDTALFGAMTTVLFLFALVILFAALTFLAVRGYQRRLQKFRVEWDDSAGLNAVVKLSPARRAVAPASFMTTRETPREVLPDSDDFPR